MSNQRITCLTEEETYLSRIQSDQPTSHPCPVYIIIITLTILHLRSAARCSAAPPDHCVGEFLLPLSAERASGGMLREQEPRKAAQERLEIGRVAK
jgi:hypothetical protein